MLYLIIYHARIESDSHVRKAQGRRFAGGQRCCTHSAVSVVGKHSAARQGTGVASPSQSQAVARLLGCAQQVC